MIQKFKNQNSINSVNFAPIDETSLEQSHRILTDLMETKGIKSRKNDRKNYFMSVHYIANDCLYCGFIKNISSGGVFIECPRNTIQKLYIGQPVTLTFDHPDMKKHIKITGKITRIEDSGIGVNFDELLQGLKPPSYDGV